MILRKIFLFPVYLYRKFISPALPKKCIYNPSCSSFMTGAVMKHGVIKGFILGIARILRCNRFFMGGFDPVPEKFSWKRIRYPYIAFRRHKNKS